ncbi:MAG: hypothetical protein AAB368_09365, partial [bacterium]
PRLAVMTPQPYVPWGAVIAPGVHRDLALTTYRRAVLGLASLQPRRTLVVGEFRTYPIPGRALFGGTVGEPPLVWTMVHGAASVPRLAAKFRQLGVTHLLHNYVTADLVGTHYARFPWTPRMLRLYADFARRRLAVVFHTDGCDYNNGGFYVYQLRPRPLDPPAPNTFFLPGAETAWLAALRFENAKRYRENLAECELLLKLLPDVGHAWNETAHARFLLNDGANAYRLYRPFAEQGMVDQLNLPEFGAAALLVGHLAEAERLMLGAIDRFPDAVEPSLVNLSKVKLAGAIDAIQHDRGRVVKALLAESEAILARIPEATTNQDVRNSRRACRAMIASLNGDLAMAAGERDRAREFYRKAMETDPEGPNAAVWKARVGQLASPTIANPPRQP